MDQIFAAPNIKETPSTPSWTSRIKGCIRKVCQTQGLNVFYATLCIIDLFGVFPIVALPGALISCGKLMQFHQQVSIEYRKFQWSFFFKNSRLLWYSIANICVNHTSVHSNSARPMLDYCRKTRSQYYW